jgi:hypothetical protein
MHPLAASNQDGIIAQREKTGDATENKLIITAILAARHDSYKTD